MKRVLLVLTVLLSGLLSQAQLKSATVQVSGLTCAMCSRTVQKALEKIPFVQSVKPDLQTQEYAVVFKSNVAVNIDQFKKEVEGAGFSIAALKLTVHFTNAAVKPGVPVSIGEVGFRFLNAMPELLNGEKTFTVIEKGFLAPKALKKFCAEPQFSCLSASDGSTRRVYNAAL